MKNDNSFIANQIINRNKYFSKALDQANEIIRVLEKENMRLRDVLTSLASLNNKDLDSSLEVQDDKFCTV